jgi:hypothetical protein
VAPHETSAYRVKGCFGERLKVFACALGKVS